MYHYFPVPLERVPRVMMMYAWYIRELGLLPHAYLSGRPGSGEGYWDVHALI